MSIVEFIAKQGQLGTLRSKISSKIAKTTDKLKYVKKQDPKPDSSVVRKEKLKAVISDIENHINNNPTDLQARLILSALKKAISN